MKRLIPVAAAAILAIAVPATASAQPSAVARQSRPLSVDSHSLHYSQSGYVITATRHHHQVGTLRLVRMTRSGSTGTATLKITSSLRLAVPYSDFHWAVKGKGGSKSPKGYRRGGFVLNHKSRQFVLHFKNVTSGHLLWAPGGRLAAIWHTP